MTSAHISRDSVVFVRPRVVLINHFGPKRDPSYCCNPMLVLLQTRRPTGVIIHLPGYSSKIQVESGVGARVDLNLVCDETQVETFGSSQCELQCTSSVSALNFLSTSVSIIIQTLYSSSNQQQAPFPLLLLPLRPLSLIKSSLSSLLLGP